MTKWDGAEDTDIEAVKGGLSDSMKRAAVQWGIGRVLYKMGTVWVDVEKRGRSTVIKDSSRPQMDKAYTDLLKRLGLSPAKAGGVQSQLTPRQEPQKLPDNVTQLPLPQTPQWQYAVESISTSKSTTTVVLSDPAGKTVKAFMRGPQTDLAPGVLLGKVELTMKRQDSVSFYLLGRYEIVGSKPRAA